MSHIKTASDLKIGEQATITGFVDDPVSLKLMEMGCLPGSIILLQYVAPFGDPICIRVAGYDLALRRKEASLILLN